MLLLPAPLTFEGNFHQVRRVFQFLFFYFSIYFLMEGRDQIFFLEYTYLSNSVIMSPRQCDQWMYPVRFKLIKNLQDIYQVLQPLCGIAMKGKASNTLHSYCFVYPFLTSRLDHLYYGNRYEDTESLINVTPLFQYVATPTDQHSTPAEQVRGKEACDIIKKHQHFIS